MPYNDLLKGRYSQANQIYFVTTVLQHRTPLFNDFFCTRKVVYEIKDLHDKNIVDSLAWVIMPDHIHWLFILNNIYTLSETMKTLKARTAQTVNQYLNKKGTV
ncbi:MAG: transposase [Methyloprofundus sp.]|nr:transposase [Methyloprofundus sp.]